MKGLRICGAAAALALSAAGCAVDRVTAAVPAEARPSGIADLLSGRAPVRVVASAGSGAVIHLRCGPTISQAHPPLFVVNGRPVSHAEFHALAIDPVSIVSIEVLKGATAVERYGRAAADGVVLITLRGR